MFTFIASFLGALVGSLVAIWYFNKKVYGTKTPYPPIKVMDGGGGVNPAGPPNEPPR